MPISEFLNHEVWDSLRFFKEELMEEFETNITILMKQLITDQKQPNFKRFASNIKHQIFEQENPGHFPVAWILLRILYNCNKKLDVELFKDHFLQNMNEIMKKEWLHL